MLEAAAAEAAREHEATEAEATRANEAAEAEAARTREVALVREATEAEAARARVAAARERFARDAAEALRAADAEARERALVEAVVVRAEAAEAEAEELRAQVAALTVEAQAAALPSPPRPSADDNDDDARLVSFAALEAATAGFDMTRVIGRGGFGPVLRGEWRGRDVAIKKLDTSSLQGDVEFGRELRVLSTCRHSALVPLLAFSMGAGAPLCLVYPFMSGGTLSERLRATDDERALSAATRLDAAAAIARALEV